MFLILPLLLVVPFGRQRLGVGNSLVYVQQTARLLEAGAHRDGASAVESLKKRRVLNVLQTKNPRFL